MNARWLVVVAALGLAVLLVARAPLPEAAPDERETTPTTSYEEYLTDLTALPPGVETVMAPVSESYINVPTVYAWCDGPNRIYATEDNLVEDSKLTVAQNDPRCMEPAQ